MAYGTVFGTLPGSTLRLLFAGGAHSTLPVSSSTSRRACASTTRSGMPLSWSQLPATMGQSWTE